MSVVAVGAFALVVAIVADLIGSFGWANRVAAVFALVAASAFVRDTPFAHWVRDVADGIAGLIASMVQVASPPGASAVREYGVQCLTILLVAMWFGAWLPKKFADRIGLDGAGAMVLGSTLVWVGSLGLAIFATAIPGRVGVGVNGVLGWVVHLGTGAVNWLFGQV